MIRWRNLATIREGEYEGLAQKLARPEWKPDFGPARMNARSGATVIGAREFLIAYNVNLNTEDRALAHDIALTIREPEAEDIGRVQSRLTWTRRGLRVDAVASQRVGGRLTVQGSLPWRLTLRPADTASAQSLSKSRFAFASYVSISGLAPGGMFSSIHRSAHLRNR